MLGWCGTATLAAAAAASAASYGLDDKSTPQQHITALNPPFNLVDRFARGESVRRDRGWCAVS